MGNWDSLIERRKLLAEAEASKETDLFQADFDDMQQKLEKLHKLVVNADVVDEAGTGILDLIKQMHDSNVEKTEAFYETMKRISAEKQMAQQAVDEIRQEQNKNTDFLNEKAKQNQAQFLQTLGKMDKLDKLDNINDGFRGLQKQMFELNELMFRVLGVLQSPKVVEYDNQGMPIGVRVE